MSVHHHININYKVLGSHIHHNNKYVKFSAELLSCLVYFLGTVIFIKFCLGSVCVVLHQGCISAFLAQHSFQCFV